MGPMKLIHLYYFLQFDTVFLPSGLKRLLGDQVIIRHNAGSPAALCSGAGDSVGQKGLPGSREPAKDTQAGRSPGQTSGFLRCHELPDCRLKVNLVYMLWLWVLVAVDS